ncbi:MAG: type I DNA topoisomerase [Gemmatimonadetes bacterium]|nr:type I DNA topoisomerase [Gemmatimonadota bacterium]
MAKALVIVESPAKARTINKFLGKDFDVKASMGHVKDLPKRDLGVDLENNFEPRYIIIRGKGKILQEIKKAAGKADAIYLAPDFDREGEAIAYHLAAYLREATDGKGKEKTIYRILFNEITEKAIREAIASPVEIDSQKVDAQQARRVLDRLVGYLISPLLWKAIYRGTSAGRVQSVALRIICEREAEIEKFVPEEFWSIDAEFTGDAKKPIHASLAEVNGEKIKIENEEQALAITDDLPKQTFSISKVDKKVRRRRPAPPFITSTLQQEAAKRFHYSARKTMQVAQSLYEGVEIGKEGPVGLITYMRTDSVRVADEAIDEVRGLIQSRYTKDDAPAKPNVYKKKKGSQDAHEAIRPTSSMRTPESMKGDLSKDQFRVYELIWSRFVASQMVPAVYDQTALDITGGPYMFRANGSVMRELGFLKAFQEIGDEKSKDRLLPPVEQGEDAALGEVQKDQHFTQPPARFTDASLVKELEANGIGRPSTYASITSTLLDRKYITRDKQRFHPSDLGRAVLKFLLINFENIFNVQFTAEMELDLDKIEEGSDEWREVVGEFYGRFEKDLETVDEKSEEVMKELKEETDVECDKCGKGMILRWGRNGRFLACSGYPDCKNTKPLEGEEPEPTGEKCEKCEGDMIIKSGRFGRFLACSNYPECKNTKSIPVGVKCPKEGCGGDLTEKRTRSGKIFYGCANYPKCNFAVWTKPVAEVCPACKFPVMVEKQSKARGPFLECANTECRHKKDLAEELVDAG